MQENKLPEEVKANLDAAVASFLAEYKAKSFSGRHPELGKMVNCPICDLRHRSSVTCKQRFTIDPKTKETRELRPPDGLTGLTRFQVLGRKPFAGKRINPHYSKKRLQLVQRTIERFPLHNGLWPSTEGKTTELVAMEVARREARADLREQLVAARSVKQSTRHRSRRINHGLLEGNSRIHR